jgi:hypothetical protein
MGGQEVPKKKPDNQDPSAKLLEKILVFQLYGLGAPQGRIAKAVGRGTTWVNDLLKGLPKGGRPDGDQAQGKKAKRRSSKR